VKFAVDVAYMGEMRNACRMLVRNHFEDLGICGWITLEWILQE